ncbi:MAG: CDP-2,3-bis-(O-geranylgeranyl)-sn-glycerol synthase [Archaeoglobaceae archaeon]
MLDVIARTIWLLLPAYLPNNFAVVLGGVKPMDFGKNFFDGKRILGEGKTFSGFFGGILGGIFIANLQRILENVFGVFIFSSINYFEFFTLALALAFGAMFGDLVGSFVKRRFNFKRGESFPVLDQISFLVFAIAIASLTPAFWKLFSIVEIVIAFIITPPLHVVVNFMAFKLKLKEVPW